MRRVLKFYALVCAILLFTGTTYAQMMPSFKGGSIQDFRSWVVRKAELTKEQKKIQGETHICFYVNSEGIVEQVEVLKTPNEELGEIYRKTVESSPKWKPATQNGRKVGVRMILPIR